jgi:3(or 17)beta-hydroxysteroid dehydrogenase
MKRVEGKAIIITGGASGVGRDAALLLAAEGARIVIADLDESAGEALARELSEAALFVRHDVASESSWASLMRSVQARFGTLHALVNSAAIFRTESIEQTSLELWHKVKAVNAAGCFLCCKYAIEAMNQQGALSSTCLRPQRWQALRAWRRTLLRKAQ